MDDRKAKDDPLKAEARAREKWRDDDALLREGDAPGHSLPESERDSGAGGGSGGAGGAVSGTILPPD